MGRPGEGPEKARNGVPMGTEELKVGGLIAKRTLRPNGDGGGEDEPSRLPLGGGRVI